MREYSLSRSGYRAFVAVVMMADVYVIFFFPLIASAAATFMVIARDSFGWDRGVWFRTTEVVRSVMVHCAEAALVYVVTEPASHVMPRNQRCSVLINERI